MRRQADSFVELEELKDVIARPPHPVPFEAPLVVNDDRTRPTIRLSPATTQPRRLKVKTTLSATILALSLSMAGSVEARPEIETVAGMLEACVEATQDPPTEMGYYCYGTVKGASQILRWDCTNRSIGYNARRGIGKVPDVTDGMAAFVIWAEAHPEFANETAVDGIQAALMEFFPCEYEQ